MSAAATAALGQREGSNLAWALLCLDNMSCLGHSGDVKEVAACRLGLSALVLLQEVANSCRLRSAVANCLDVQRGNQRHERAQQSTRTETTFLAAYNAQKGPERPSSGIMQNNRVHCGSDLRLLPWTISVTNCLDPKARYCPTFSSRRAPLHFSVDAATHFSELVSKRSPSNHETCHWAFLISSCRSTGCWPASDATARQFQQVQHPASTATAVTLCHITIRHVNAPTCRCIQTPQLHHVHSFCCCSAQGGAYSVSVLGDLHLEPAQMHLFHEARQQLVAAMAQPNSSSELSGARVVQLGDLGGYDHRPGQ